METFTRLFGSSLLFVHHCFDRVVINGYLSGLSRPGQVAYFFQNALGEPVIGKEVLSRRTSEYRGDGNQYLHRSTDDYRAAVRRKLHAFHLHVQLGCIAQGLLQHLSINHTAEVWRSFQSWLRTMNPTLPPSELMTANALRAAIPGFFASSLFGPQTEENTEPIQALRT